MLKELESPVNDIIEEYSLSTQDVSLLCQWTGDAPMRSDDLVHRQFSSVSNRYGDKTAVCAWDGELTYSQLDELSSQLAWHLQALGVGPEIFIPICLEKTHLAVVAVLGVIKSGGAFVLLDPSHPTERLKEVYKDVQARVMITSTHQEIPLATQRLAATIIDITDPSSKWRHSSTPRTPPASSVQSTNAVWCAFTSGSSGRPKGVVIEHVAFCSLTATYIEKARLTPYSRVLQFASFAFDACITDILATLLAGGCVCVPSERERREDLGNAATRMQVNWANLTPTVFRTMVPPDFPTLQTVILSGEPMSIREVRVWQDNVHLMNVYGPAEGCVKFTLQPSITSQSDLRNIGYPMAGDCWVVNPSDHNKLVPIGAVGELILGGPRIGRGYINNPAANTASFITEPPPWLKQFREHTDGTRLYKTGDLVSYAADGSLCFIGRKDLQIKIRGQRVETSEIETIIQQLFPLAKGVIVELVSSQEESSPKVLTAFIEVKHDGCGDIPCQSSEKSLFAVPCGELQRSLVMLEQKLRNWLPVYMIPARLLIVRLLPSTASGKTDRRKLREQASILSLEELALFTSGSQHQRQLPSTPAEEVVWQVCAEVLKLPAESIGMNDSFFHLGGDSILAIQLASRARQKGTIFKVMDIFQSPRLIDLSNIACYSQVLQGCPDPQTTLQAPLIMPVALEDVLANIPASSRHILYPENVHRILPVTDGQRLRLHEPCKYFILRICGNIDIDQLNATCQALLRRHEILRSVFRNHNSMWVQIVLKHLELHLVRYKTDADRDLLSFVKDICEEDEIAIPPLDVPLAYFSFVQGHDDSAFLILRLSHALYDGYSWGIISKDLKHLYDNLALSEPVPYSVHMEQWARAQVDKNSLEFWQRYLTGFRMSHIGDITRTASATLTNSYMVEAETKIPFVEPPAGITLATVVKVAWALTLARFTGIYNVAFGLTTSGRSLDSLATNEIVGLCMNRVAVCIQPDLNQTVLKLMESVQRQYAESLAFELVEYCNIVEDTKESMFGSVLTFQNTRFRQKGFELGQAKCSWVPLSIGSLRTRNHVELEVLPGDNDLEIWLGAPNIIWGQDRANEILRVLSRFIPLLAENAEVRLCNLGF
ncbi:acetyl-CoA synthetase-like protein [Penicillium taxi]|uniref:acetyl-CoA synthetase-like protein n=1 Tax=Penicillium taxi TaxID=168475 RepID=UPI0025456DC2|nr:acetyl-CoA synthetase-like protein [Penicillium taxi]KAJ5908654.1 acetyl-CoA synthetase-like protein [Penicillium taxi]